MTVYFPNAIILILCLVFGMNGCTKDPKGNAADYWEHGGQNPKKPEDPVNPDEQWFKMIGIVAGWSDVGVPEQLDYVKIAKESGINTFSIYNADRSSVAWKNFANRCKDAGIDLEFEEHMMSFLLPRDLFETHPEYFRMDKYGRRVKDANGCPSSKEGLAIVHKNAIDIGKRYHPTNNKYYFWLDDGGDVCHCPLCKDYNDAEQALIFENEVIAALKEINTDAKLAHLCYANTVEPPKKIKPHEDIFLEFAPFYRNWEQPLSSAWAKGRNGLTNGDYVRKLKEHLTVFPAETAQVLEYWMDDSLYSNWDPNNLVKLPWKSAVFQSDIKTYASMGIRNITCYSAYVGPSYLRKFGDVSFLTEYGQSLRDYRPK